MRYTTAFCLLALCGCNDGNSPQAGNPAQPLWFRYDCRLTDTAPLQMEFTQAREICLNRGEAQGTAGAAAVPDGVGIGGAIASGIRQGVTHNQIRDASMTSCMAERGYSFITPSEFVSRCPSSPAAEAIDFKPPQGAPLIGLNLVPVASGHGMMIGRVGDGTPASLAGLRPTDIVTAINGHKVNNYSELTKALAGLIGKGSAVFKVEREHKPFEAELKFQQPG